ncbi:BolA/IbaG family iron-sulfur metabolism protein [bacterium]|nr:BolA/IbaG family iron-sulfur metabolism protein [bacterium]NCQ55089.1 BolA/IbaG family iron-sulfur metabolism protein [Candidatus Parcubacteria bacterium]NCS67133.1 BolA/IbaG family iron-sulfur metabolism protein [Candidatus Peregrinibacteria bacterium]NCS96079.1 BolA/IbaG family iron-sulfur metabolism protein [bacterium]
MKLCDQIQKALEAHFKTVLIRDERGDGHFVQVVCVDDIFNGQSLVARSRGINKVVLPWQEKVHAWSVKGFTFDEWERKKDTFEYQQYQHYPKY